MRELSDIVTSLLDKDWSCRDLNFEGPTWAGVRDLLVSLESAFGEISGTDQEGNVLPDPLRDSVMAVEEDRGQVRLIFNAGVGLSSLGQATTLAKSESDRIHFCHAAPPQGDRDS